MKQIYILILALIALPLQAQEITGVVNDENNEPLIGANVYIKGTYNGATTNAEGRFIIVPESNEPCTLVVRFVGYSMQEIAINDVAETQALTFILEPEAGTLDEVVITAGSFEAGDKKRAVLLSAIDVATTASSDGDIYGALTTFPGAQKQGETGEIIVRGGESHETKTYIDGMLVSSPYYSTMPDLPSRGRFSPFMFNGIAFSTGGYSAEYGQALSSVLVLTTPGLFDESTTSVSLMNVGVGASHTVRNERSAYSGEFNYSNLTPFFLMAQHDLDWVKVPQSLSGSFMHRVKAGETGMIKSFINYSYSNSELNYQTAPEQTQNVALTNNNLYYNTTYNAELNDKWLIKSGVAYNRNKDLTNVADFDLVDDLSTLYAKLGFINYTSNSVTLKFGSEATYADYEMDIHDSEQQQNYLLSAYDVLSGAYVEGDIKLSRKVAMRLGGRGEYSTLTGNYNIAPRGSLAYKVSKSSQFSFAAGKYYQQAHRQYLKYSDELDFEVADHYILNYQFQVEKRVLRTELYYKNYNSLVTYQTGEEKEFENLGNRGDGFAKGLDVFWRDNKSLRNVDYWVSYSFIDSKRQFKNYPSSVTPDFVIEHNVSIVYKQWLHKLNTQLSMAYAYMGGRPYDNPNIEGFMSDKTKANHDLSGNLSYITNIFGNFTVVHLSVSNILGLDAIYSYRFSPNPNENGEYAAMPVNSKTGRTVIVGLFINFN